MIQKLVLFFSVITISLSLNAQSCNLLNSGLKRNSNESTSDKITLINEAILPIKNNMAAIKPRKKNKKTIGLELGHTEKSTHLCAIKPRLKSNNNIKKVASSSARLKPIQMKSKNAICAKIKRSKMMKKESKSSSKQCKIDKENQKTSVA